MSSGSLRRNSSVILCIENEWLTYLSKEPVERSSEDSEIIYSKLKTLRVFDGYPEDLLREIAVYTTYEEIPPHTTLFRPGDEGLFWYTVLSGSLEMLQEESVSNQVNSICCLGEGSSFGEGVIFGSKRETMIVTTDHCQLLCVEADNIRNIYKRHQASMKSLVNFPGRPPSVVSTNSDIADGLVNNESEVFTSDECTLSIPVFTAPETELTLAGLTLYQIILEHFPDLLSDHQVNMYTYKKCCSGKKLVDWVLEQSSAARSRQQIIAMWQALLTEGIIQHVIDNRSFADESQVYYKLVEREIPESARVLVRPVSPSTKSNDTRRMTNGSLSDSPIMSRSSTLQSVNSTTTEGSPTSSPRSSIASLLEECFDVISQLGPESLIFATLMRKPAERTDEDVQLIYEELLHVKAFSHLSNAIKEELASVVQFENHPTAGKFLFREGDEGTSWYIILRGSVNVMIGKKDVVCTLQEGDEFGKLALLNNAPRTTSIQLRESNCCFLRVERDDYKRILMSVEKNTVKIKEQGKEVLHLEKNAGGRYLIVKGTPTKMLQYLLTLQIDPGELDSCFAQDFFLTYPAFMSINQICDGLLDAYNDTSPPAVSPFSSSSHRNSRLSSVEDAPPTANEEQILAKKQRVVRVIMVWLEIAKGDLVKDPTFLQMLSKIQDLLVQDKLDDEMKSLTAKLTDSIKQRQAAAIGDGIKSSSGTKFPLKKAHTTGIRIELGICTIPPCQPIDTVHMRVHSLDRQCCRLHIKHGTKAKEILKEACEKLSLDFDEHQLCEGKSSGEKFVFKDEDLSITTEITVNGRLYVVPKEDAPKTIPPLPDQLKKPVEPFPDTEPSREIALNLTIYDWNLFINIQQMEFIYQVFGRHRFSKITSNLDLLTRRFNEVQYWVATEVCNETNVQRRVKILTKFIRIASRCKSFNNLNSFFAIVVGLMNGGIARLKQTWEKVPVKLKHKFERFEVLMDLSRNHRVLRAYQSKLQPPVIPFMPLVVKDAFFLHEGNETFVDNLVNFEKMRMVASKVRDLNVYRQGTLPYDVKSSSPNKRGVDIQKYIRDLKVIDSQQVLMQMSYSIEPSKRERTTST